MGLVGVVAILSPVAVWATDTASPKGVKLASAQAEVGAAFGYVVAFATDARTALVGAPADEGSRGAAYVFVRVGMRWIEQARLSLPGDIAGFGGAVALSRNGNTALIGASANDGYVGAAWVFVRSSGRWHEQTRLRPRGETGRGYFGFATALSASGNFAFVTAPNDDVKAGQKFGRGAAWVFAHVGRGWHQNGGKLVANGETAGGTFGWSIAVSADGREGVSGAPGDSHQRGAAWFFARTGAHWHVVGTRVVGVGEDGLGQFGWSVAVSGDGSTAMISAFYDKARAPGTGGPGAVWTYVHGGRAWRLLGKKLTSPAPAKSGSFGFAVALSHDGKIALITAPDEHSVRGDAWVFLRKGSHWASRPTPLLPSQPGDRYDGFGWSAALTPNGTAALIGAPGADRKRGVAWGYALGSG
jgi:hypothetical protein